jgi:hypothetical protein
MKDFGSLESVGWLGHRRWQLVACSSVAIVTRLGSGGPINQGYISSGGGGGGERFVSSF